MPEALGGREDGAMTQRTLKEIAAANDMTLEEYIKHSTKKKAPPANEAERKRQAD